MTVREAAQRIASPHSTCPKLKRAIPRNEKTMAEASSASPSLIANGLGEGAGTGVGEGVGVGEDTTARNSDAGGVSAFTTRPSLRFVSVAGISLTIAVPNAVASIAPIEAVYELFVEARSLVGTSTSI